MTAATATASNASTASTLSDVPSMVLSYFQAHGLTILGITLAVIVVLALTLYVGSEAMRPNGPRFGRVASILLMPFYGLFCLIYLIFSRLGDLVEPIIVSRRRKKNKDHIRRRDEKRRQDLDKLFKSIDEDECQPHQKKNQN